MHTTATQMASRQHRRMPRHLRCALQLSPALLLPPLPPASPLGVVSLLQPVLHQMAKQGTCNSSSSQLSTSKCHYQAWNGMDTIGSPSSVMMEDMPCAACARNTLTMPSSSTLQAKRYGVQGPFCGYVQA